MAVPTSGRTINIHRGGGNRWKPINAKGKILHLLQVIIPFLRDDGYYNYRALKKNREIRYKILRDTNWLAVTTHFGSNSSHLPFHEQAVKYFEYKNMVVQRRAQSVIIFLTIALLLMTGLQIYFQFLK